MRPHIPCLFEKTCGFQSISTLHYHSCLEKCCSSSLWEVYQFPQAVSLQGLVDQSPNKGSVVFRISYASTRLTVHDPVHQHVSSVEQPDGTDRLFCGVHCQVCPDSEQAPFDARFDFPQTIHDRSRHSQSHGTPFQSYVVEYIRQPSLELKGCYSYLYDSLSLTPNFSSRAAKRSRKISSDRSS